MSFVQPVLLHNFATRVLEKLGLTSTEAELVAETLIEADMQGVSTHGIIRLVTYARRVAAGGIKVPTKITVVREGPCTALLDAGAAFGQLAAFRAAQMAVAKAAQCGVGVVGVRNSNHFGRAGYYTEYIARQEMIGICLSNASPRLAPWGGRKPLLGNNPWSIGVPGEPDILFLDMANSIAAAGKIREAAKLGKPIPPGWALDRNGRPTTDPVQALEGILLPFGEYKGYGITLMVGVLTGLLTGGKWDAEIKPVDALDSPQEESHLVMALRITDFTPLEEFKKRISSIVSQIKSSPRADGFSEIFLPGEIERRRRVESEKKGIALSPSTIAVLQNLALELNVSPL
ncbi:MAG: Ldh family oxidoreductase [Firmicutes bacterium]|nr:Ldh family oxidoreductase [Bacillota bacterium]MCL5039626.1 Ldh family oxidoreductase [Bacillota bacterium]